MAMEPKSVGTGTKTNTIIVKFPKYSNMATEFDFKIEISPACAIVAYAPSSAAPASNIMFYFGASVTSHAIPTWTQTTAAST